jgi:hypothetical protein
MDAKKNKASLGGESTGPNPPDRAKSGTKRRLLVDRYGVGIGSTMSGANTHNTSWPSRLSRGCRQRPEPTRRKPQNMCVDKGDDFPRDRRAHRRVGIYRPRLEEGSRPLQEKGDAGLSSEETGRREDPIVAEPVQEAPGLVEGEEKRTTSECHTSHAHGQAGAHRESSTGRNFLTRPASIPC